MNTDPTRNTVAFGLQRADGEEVVIADAPTRADDSIQQAWQAVRSQHDADPAEVSDLEAEWRPSEQDERFIAQTFPSCKKVRYHFERPSDPRGWEEAFAAARRNIQEAMREHGYEDRERREQAEREEAIRQQVVDALASRRSKAAAGGDGRTQPPPAAGGSLTDQLRRIEAQEGGKLIPVLLGPSSQRGQAVLEWDFVLREPLVPEKVFVALALASRTPHGTIRLNWYSRKHHHLQLREPPFSKLLEFTAGNLRHGLRGAAYLSDDGPLITLEREEYHAASAVALPDFYDEMSARLEARRLIVGIPCARQLIVADADSGNAYGVRGSTLEGGHDDDFLGPTVLLVEGNSVEVLAERQI